MINFLWRAITGADLRFSLGGGGGGASTSNAYTPPDYILPGLQDAVNNLTAITQTPQQQYYGMQVAPINNAQVQGIQSMMNTAGNYAPDYAAARAQNQITASGGYEDPTFGLQTQVGFNPYFGQAVGGNNGEVTMGTPDLINPYTTGPDGGKYAFGVRGEDLGQGGSLANPFLDINNPNNTIGLRPNKFIDSWTNVGQNEGLGPDPSVGENQYIGDQTNVWKNSYMGQTTDVGRNKWEGLSSDPGQNQFLGQNVNVGQNDWLGRMSDTGSNQYIPQNTQLDQNQYMGFSPEFEAQQDRAANKMVKAYQQGTAAQTDSAMNRPGAFGGGAHVAQIANNEAGLAEGLSNLYSSMNMEQWQNSGQLAEGGLNRSLSAQQGDLGRQTQYTDAELQRYLNQQQTDYARNAGINQDMLSLNAQTGLADLGRNAQYADAGLGRSLNAQQTDYARNSGLAQDDINLRAQTGLADIGRNAQMGQDYQSLLANVGLQDASRNMTGQQNYLGLQNQNAQSNAARNAQYGQAGQDLRAQTMLADLQRNANLDQSSLGYDLQAQTTDLARLSGLADNQIGRIQQQVQTDDARNAALQESRVARDLQNRNQFVDRNANLASQAQQYGMQAQQGDYNRWSQGWDNERNRQVGSLQGAIGAGQFDLGNAQAMISGGDMQRQYQQDMLNQYQNSFNQWNQFPQQTWDTYINGLQRAGGNFGTNTATTQQNYQTSPYAAMLGTGLLGGAAGYAWGSP